METPYSTTHATEWLVLESPGGDSSAHPVSDQFSHTVANQRAYRMAYALAHALAYALANQAAYGVANQGAHGVANRGARGVANQVAYQGTNVDAGTHALDRLGGGGSNSIGLFLSRRNRPTSGQ